MKPRLLLLGANGQLGIELHRVLASEFLVTALTRSELDLTDGNALREAMRSLRPAITVNAAAYTAVDRAETDRAAAFAVNATAPRILAEEADRIESCLLHFSTDYVFDGSGQRPWLEQDETMPLNVYGQSKQAGEEAIAATGCRHYILRTSWLYTAHGNNFFRTMLRLGSERRELRVVSDQIGSPTSAGEVARGVLQALLTLVDGSEAEPGIYHMACSGSASWYQFAEAILQHMENPPVLLPIATHEYPTPAKRPPYSVLNTEKLWENFQVRLSPWHRALEEVWREFEVLQMQKSPAAHATGL